MEQRACHASLDRAYLRAVASGCSPLSLQSSTPRVARYKNTRDESSREYNDSRNLQTPEIMNSMIKIVVSVAALSILFGEIFAMPLAQCSPGLLDEVPPKVRKICAALSTIYQIQSAMESYVGDKVLEENNPLPGSGVKRQDVDHVFLRFGRRR
ncbi:myosuppressin-like isoform X2 [Vespa mandarinia]|uniref:myosuppressin-like isoform X2 n=1 Tax=Vespa mandarinia TaxID=7446 RepID=UPI00161E2705|nr:myosuppressin-like isoform X2 [Vespa mandarinia]XP_047369194.1 myosuppressin isoform X2 [Vespa velutina]